MTNMFPELVFSPNMNMRKLSLQSGSAQRLPLLALLPAKSDLILFVFHINFGCWKIQTDVDTFYERFLHDLDSYAMILRLKRQGCLLSQHMGRLRN